MPAHVEISTYGTLRGPAPAGTAIEIDLTALHNPAKDPGLRGLTGLDAALAAHVLATPGSRETVDRAVVQALALAPLQPSGEPLRIRVRCRWGRHRSVAVAQAIAAALRGHGLDVEVHHRDVHRPAIRPQDCPFCRIVAGTAPAVVVRRWDDVIAIRPRSGGVHPGHVLVIPHAHVADAGVDPAITALTMAAAADMVAEQPAANVITSKGEAASQTVHHLHAHIVPRVEGDGLALPWPHPVSRVSRSR
ncbi:RapZ C-terminal domain-containing protein [Marinactinospora thermotolerans]|uniref:HIT family protein n=1 Tax=Marinactinospora thermotolerans TaxID=531310 RepID=UPI003D8FC6ED